MSKEIKLDLKTLVICAIIIVGLVLAIVGLFGNILKAEYGGITMYSKLSDLADGNKDSSIKWFVPTAIFSWATFALAILTACAFVAVKFLGVKLPKNGLLLIGALTALCAILALVFSIAMANKYDLKVAAGPILMLIGGLLCCCGAAASEKF